MRTPLGVFTVHLTAGLFAHLIRDDRTLGLCESPSIEELKTLSSWL